MKKIFTLCFLLSSFAYSSSYKCEKLIKSHFQKTFANKSHFSDEKYGASLANSLKCISSDSILSQDKKKLLQESVKKSYAFVKSSYDKYWDLHDNFHSDELQRDAYMGDRETEGLRERDKLFKIVKESYVRKSYSRYCKQEADALSFSLNSRMEESKKLDLVLKNVINVESCIEVACEPSSSKKEDIIQKVSNSVKRIDQEHKRYFRLQASNIDELQRDAYMGDASSFIYKSAQIIVHLVKKECK